MSNIHLHIEFTSTNSVSICWNFVYYIKKQFKIALTLQQIVHNNDSVLLVSAYKTSLFVSKQNKPTFVSSEYHKYY